MKKNGKSRDRDSRRISIGVPELEDIVFTKTQANILEALGTDNALSAWELVSQLTDDLAQGTGAIRFHIYNIRSIIRPLGYSILIQFKGKTPHYRLVKLLSEPAENTK